MADSSVTKLLEAARCGNEEATGELFLQTYSLLHGLASTRVGRGPDGMLQPTALLNEAILRILKAGSLSRTRNQAGFLSLVAKSMRSVLVDNARRQSAAKREHVRVHSQIRIETLVHTVEKLQHVDMLILDEALKELRGYNERQHDVVMLRFFGGLKFSEIAKELKVSLATVERDWCFARAWLRARIDEEEE